MKKQKMRQAILCLQVLSQQQSSQVKGGGGVRKNSDFIMEDVIDGS